MFNIRIANLMGLDINNAQHSVAIDEALIGVDNKEAFYEFCRDKKNGIEFETKPEKLITLANMYKKLQENAKLPHDTALKFTDGIVKKMNMAKAAIKNAIEEGKQNPISNLSLDGSKFFSIKELKALGELGSTARIIELTETGELRDELMKVFMSKFKSKSKYEALTNNQKKVMALTARAGV